MKKSFVSYFLAFIALAAFVSCSKTAPKDVAREWLTAFYHLDYDAAKQYSTEDTKNMLNVLEGFTNALPDSTKQRAKSATINIKSLKEDANTATVTFTTSEEPNKEQPPLKMVKQDNKWLVQFTKADFTGGDNADMQATGGATITQDAPTAPATADAPMTTPDTAAEKK